MCYFNLWYVIYGTKYKKQNSSFYIKVLYMAMHVR